MSTFGQKQRKRGGNQRKRTVWLIVLLIVLVCGAIGCVILIRNNTVSPHSQESFSAGFSQSIVDSDPDHYDSKFSKKGDSYKNPIGGYTTRSSSQGCYIATCVYSSYDCPEVWVLRRFRDEFLRKRSLGRTFVKVYYQISPWVVKRAGGCSWFRRVWRKVLDRWVERLEKGGYDNSPYEDQ